MPELQWNHKVFTVNKAGFEGLALEVFRYQAGQNPVYKAYLEALGVDPAGVSQLLDIPFLPIRFFRSHEVKTGSFEPSIVFESSGTTGTIPGRHYIKDLSLYEESFTKGFELFYGDPGNYTIFALLPSYTERPGSSLVYMVEKLIRKTTPNRDSKFFPVNNKTREWIQVRDRLLDKPGQSGKKNLVIGVTFALLDLAEPGPLELKNTIIMETGGMKGRRQEMVRQELHEVLQKAFGVPVIHSEYGMTELLSQAYSNGGGIFHCPPWMKVLVRDEEDPLTIKTNSPDQPQPGVINIIDLANIYSCSFIATDDLGKLYPDGSFEVLGRMDGSDLRGCSLMVI